MFRFALNDLKQWINNPSRNPLVMRGARQVGKTWLVRELARSCNKTLIEINFELNPEKKGLFKENEPQKVCHALEMNLQKSISIQNTLLFLDEIQTFPLMLAKLRWFKECMPELAVVVAGSLLEFILDAHDFSMPVGRISYFHLEPLSFDEFLYAKNRPMLDAFNTYHVGDDMPSTIHAQALAYLKEYCMVGGLPAVVSCWLEQASWAAIRPMHYDILTTYRDDFMRYKGRYDLLLFDDVFYAIPKNIGNKVVYRHMHTTANTNALKQIFSLMAKARIIHRIQASAANGIPLAAEINPKCHKAICLDVGLMNGMLGIPLQQTTADRDWIHKGAVAEQVVGQLLRTIEPYYIEPKLYYWQRHKTGSNAEVDYLIQHDATIVPIEVKAGKKGRMQSLHQWMQLKKRSTAVRLDTNRPSQLTVDTKTSDGKHVHYQLLTLPIYMIGQLKRLLTETWQQ